MANILNQKKDGIALFDAGIQINKSLAKWKNAKVSLTDRGRTFIVPQTMLNSETGTASRVVDLGGMATTIGNGSITIINNAPTEGWGDTSDSEVKYAEGAEPKKKELSEIASMELRELNKYINDSGFIYTLTKTGRYKNGEWGVAPNDVPFVEWGRADSGEKLIFTDKVKLLF